MARQARYRWTNLRVARSGRTIKSDPKRDVGAADPMMTANPWRNMTAKYAGTCACGCGEVIRVGDPIRYNRTARRTVKRGHG